MKPKFGAEFKATVSMANATGNPEDGYDLVVLSGFRSAAHAQQFGNYLIQMGLAELPAPFETANANKLVM